MKLTLPIPPSNNHYKRYYCTRSTRDDPHQISAFVTDKAKQYKHDAGWTAKAAGAKPINGDVVVVIDVYLGKADIDADNIPKVVFDALNGIAWEDDSQIVEYRVRKHRGNRKRRIEISIMEIAKVGDEY